MFTLDNVDKRLLGLLFGLMAVFWVLPIPGHPVFIVLAIYALRGPKETIESFFFLFLFLLGNGAVMPGGGKALRWFVLFAGLFAVIPGAVRRWRNGESSNMVVLLTGGFMVSMIMISALTSKLPLVSLLKIIGLAAGAMSILLGFQQTQHLREHWVRTVNTFFVFFIGASLLLYFMGSGFERNGLGFQGIFSHPQVMGPVAACMAAWLSGQYLLGQLRSRLMLVITVMSWFVLFLSQSRTALLAALGGLLLARFFFMIQGRPLRLSPGIQKGAVFLFFGVLIFVGTSYERLIAFTSEFLNKDNTVITNNVGEIFEQSRGWLIEKSMANFYDYPLLGIGLGVPSDYQNGARNVEYFMGIPVSASVEKGFLPSAILEEMGLFGALFTMALLIMTTALIIRRGNFAALWLILAAWLVNIGEAVFFSIGGQGFFVWLMLGFSYFLATSETQQRSYPFRLHPG